MPLFSVDGRGLASVEQTNFPTEKVLQGLIEANLSTVFGCRFVASEFSTGIQHGGRIDTLALSEDGNPVIIEYKKVESSELINQSLYYLAWLKDHKGDFEVAVKKSLGGNVEIEWSHIRVICIAPNYKKFDLHAAQVRGADIELWTYRFFKNQTLFVEEVLQRSYAPFASRGTRSSGQVGMDAATDGNIDEATVTYTFEGHVAGKPANIQELAIAVEDFIMGLDPAMEEAPKKLYVAYKISRNIVCMEVHRQKITLFLSLNPKEQADLPDISRDVSSIGHYGTGDLELTLTNLDDLEIAKPLIHRAYENIGS
ncbi:MAG: DUF5655 domain-containing protein [Dehalococcoidia bacterium]